MAPITMGELTAWAPPPEEVEYFRRFVKVLDEFYPEQWRLWEIQDESYTDLFGDQISSDDECRLRFAVPTMELARIFSDSPPQSLSERKYKKIKRILLSWPLGRATIYTPFSTMKKIHPDEAFNGFLSALPDLKPHLIPRAEADKLLRGSHTPSSLSSRAKRARSTDMVEQAKRARTTNEPEASFMKQQNSILEKLNATIESLQTQLLGRDKIRVCCESDSSNDSSEANSWTAPSFQQELPPEEAQGLNPNNEEDVFLDFAPQTKETEAKISAADEDLAQQGIQCQRLGMESWQNIRYAEVQKKFQAAPVFTNLRTNSNLATVTPSWQLVTILEKMDLCLGAITHGLLQQRKEFQEIYQKSSLEVKRAISANFLATDAPFRRTSDTLLQYTCGKRAEVIQNRRSIYKPSNKVLNELLHAIPPSSTHLFAEPQLSDLVKEQGGINKFFPGKTKFKQRPGYKETSQQSHRQDPKGKTRVPNFLKRQQFRPHDKQQQTTSKPDNRRTSGGKPNKSRFEGRKF